MIRVTCQLDDYSNPAQPCIKVHNHWNGSRNVEIEVDGKRYVVKGSDLIEAVKNAMNTNEWGM